MHSSFSSPAMAASPDMSASKLPLYVFRGLDRVHSLCGLHTHQVTFINIYTGGFGHFISSTSAPTVPAGSKVLGRDLPRWRTVPLQWARDIGRYHLDVRRGGRLNYDTSAGQHRLPSRKIKTGHFGWPET
jgi:hypothetical protein